MVDRDGVLPEERGVDTTGMKGMKGNEMRQRLKLYPDFQNQTTVLEEYVGENDTFLMYTCWKTSAIPIYPVLPYWVITDNYH